ncbi:MAG: zinc ABC transporter substrate-binding protein [Pseudomonadota bacterium]|nr:zinc ABC transporter substrate-binding protein [Pseudomonadota bacterium]
MILRDRPLTGAASRSRNTLVLMVLALALVALPKAGEGGEVLRVFVSVPPQQTFVERIGGERVQVRTMVQPGHSPATYDPSPRQVAELAKADLYVRTGVPFEDAWMTRIRAANPDLRMLDVRKGIPLRELSASDQGDVAGGSEAIHVHGEEKDPHIWTSPPLVKIMARNIRDTLSELDPTGGHDYAANYAAFAAELDALDRDIREQLAHLPARRFMVFHPAWGYFADTYGLTQVPIETEGKEPGPRTLAALIEQAKREGVKVVFVQPQFDEKSAQQVARAIGGRVEFIDPLSPDYVQNLRRVTRLIAQAGTP